MTQQHSPGPWSTDVTQRMRHDTDGKMVAYAADFNDYGRDYWRLEGNELYILPLPIEVGIGADGVKRWYPAAIVPEPWPSTGSYLVPLVNAQLCGEYNPALRNVCKLRLIVQDADTPRRSRVQMRRPELGGVA